MLITAIIALFVCSHANGREDRHICQNAYEAIANKAETFKTGADWFPYPKYSDRAGWDQLTGNFKESLIKGGQKYLRYKWQVIPATLYLEYEKTGNRNLYKPLNENTEALNTLIMAELAEGKGRFMPQIINGIYFFATMPSWNGSGSDCRDRIRNRMLPAPDFHLIALTSAARGPMMAFALHFFKEELDKYDPSIYKTVYKSIESHILDPYLDEYRYLHGHEWLGFGRYTHNHRVNNWNTYCNGHVILTYLLADQNQERLLKALEQCARSIDCYLDFNKFDGACDEGPSYWNMAGGKVFEYAKLMYECTGGKMNILEDEQVRRIMEWKSKNYVTDGYLVAFGDGEAHGNGDYRLYYRIGQTMNMPEMSDFGISMAANPVKQKFSNKISAKTDLYRCLESLRYQKDFEAAQQQALANAGGDWNKMMIQLREKATSFWYPETEHAYLRTKNGWFIGVKGGHNNESHNHNDVGSGVFFVENCPILIDPGVSTYGKNTFGDNRYKNWHIQSQWHNAPIINGQMQNNGNEFKAEGTTCDIKKNVFTTDIAGAYPAEAKVKKWQRTWSLNTKEMVVTDNFILEERTKPVVENFITDHPIYLAGQQVEGYTVKEGEALIAATSFDGTNKAYILMTFPKELKATAEMKDVDEKRMQKSWKSDVYRLQLTSPKDAPLEGTYIFRFTRLYL
jgi:hypothetical protein